MKEDGEIFRQEGLAILHLKDKIKHATPKRLVVLNTKIIEGLELLGIEDTDCDNLLWQEVHQLRKELTDIYNSWDGFCITWKKCERDLLKTISLIDLEKQNAELKMGAEKVGEAVINLYDPVNSMNMENSILEERLSKLEIGNKYVAGMIPGKSQLSGDEVVKLNKKLKKELLSLTKNILRLTNEASVQLKDIQKAAFSIYDNATGIMTKLPPVLEKAINKQVNVSKDLAEEANMEETVNYLKKIQKKMEEVQNIAAEISNEMFDTKEFEKTTENFRKSLKTETRKFEADSAGVEVDVNTTANTTHSRSGTSELIRHLNGNSEADGKLVGMANERKIQSNIELLKIMTQGNPYNHQQFNEQGMYLTGPPIQEDQISSSTEYNAGVQTSPFYAVNAGPFEPVGGPSDRASSRSRGRQPGKRARKTPAVPRVPKRRRNN